MTPFIYLVQGQKELVGKCLELDERAHADAIFLTYDESLDGAIYYPDSTWAEGRNRLLEAALEKGEYLYYIFCDDDIAFKKGSWSLLEENLLKYLPAIAVPVFPRTRLNILKFPRLEGQPFFVNDEQLLAFHRDVVHDRLTLPYQTQFDKINWWVSCEIQQILIQNFYPNGAIQFNRIQVENTCKERYNHKHDNDKSFRKIVQQWLGKQFKIDYRLTSFYNPPRLHQIYFRLILFLFNNLLGRKQWQVKPETLSKMLYPESDIARQASGEKK